MTKIKSWLFEKAMRWVLSDINIMVFCESISSGDRWIIKNQTLQKARTLAAFVGTYSDETIFSFSAKEVSCCIDSHGNVVINLKVP